MWRALRDSGMRSRGLKASGVWARFWVLLSSSRQAFRLQGTEGKGPLEMNSWPAPICHGKENVGDSSKQPLFL